MHFQMLSCTYKFFLKLFAGLVLLSLWASFSFAQSVGPFLDIPRTHLDYTAIDFFAVDGTLQGYDDGTFRSDNQITRAAALKILLIGSQVPLDVPYQSELFPDLQDPDEWFIAYVMKAHALGIVSGNQPEGTFDAGDSINLAAFTKMLFETNRIDVALSEDSQIVPGIDVNQWYGPYLNEAVLLGILAPGDLDPGQWLTRGDVVRMMYLTKLVLNGSDTQFLLDRSEAEMAQIGIYIESDDLTSAKIASRRAYDLTQQAYRNLPENMKVLAVAKLALAYDALVDMIIAALEGNKDLALEKGNLVILKATEAWQANNATQPLAAYLKERARGVAAQIGVELAE